MKPGSNPWPIIWRFAEGGGLATRLVLPATRTFTDRSGVRRSKSTTGRLSRCWRRPTG